MAYWLFDTNAVIKLHKLQVELGDKAVRKFIGDNTILITRRIYHELRMGDVGELAHLAKVATIASFEADNSTEDEALIAHAQPLISRRFFELNSEGVATVALINPTILAFDGTAKQELYANYFPKVAIDRTLITTDYKVIERIWGTVERVSVKFRFKFDPTTINFINYPSTYLFNFVWFKGFLKRPERNITPNDFYDLINIMAAPLADRFYGEKSMISNLKTLKGKRVSTPYTMLKNLYPETANIYKNEAALRKESFLIPDLRLYTLSELERQVRGG